MLDLHHALRVGRAFERSFRRAVTALVSPGSRQGKPAGWWAQALQRYIERNRAGWTDAQRVAFADRLERRLVAVHGRGLVRRVSLTCVALSLV